MSSKTVRCCDECAAIRGETNHWWSVLGAAAKPMFLKFEDAERRGTSKKRRRNGLRLDFCSHKCVSTAFHRWLDTGTVVKLVAVKEVKPEENADADTTGSFDN